MTRLGNAPGRRYMALAPPHHCELNVQNSKFEIRQNHTTCIDPQSAVIMMSSLTQTIPRRMALSFTTATTAVTTIATSATTLFFDLNSTTIPRFQAQMELIGVSACQPMSRSFSSSRDHRFIFGKFCACVHTFTYSKLNAGPHCVVHPLLATSPPQTISTAPTHHRTTAPTHQRTG